MGNKSTNIQFKAWFPHFVVIVWLIFLGVTIWSHAVSSQQPPIYDSISYFQKAKNLWGNIDRGEWSNPFNIKPTVRPPGTVLMSYPFGFTSEFHGYHFRSVYFPILSVGIAVYVSIGLSRALAIGWGVAGVALLLSSLPLFYQFEWVDRTQSQWSWGMVDSFQAGVAALAAAACVRSLISRSLRWLGLGAVLASFTLLIKPSGIMVMALLALTWFVLAMWALRTAPQNSAQPFKERRYVLYGVLNVVIIYATFIILCVTSEYLSPENFAYARQALVVMKDILAIPLSEYPALIHRSMGEAVFIWAAAIIALHWTSPYGRSGLDEQGNSPKTTGFLLMACLVWAGGAWFWLVVQAGGGQIRYFFPFALIGFIYLVPMAIEVWWQARFRVRGMILVMCVLPAVNMACLLLLQNPPALWQTVTGVNVNVGTSRLEENQAHAFLDRVRKIGKNVKLYVFKSDIPAVAFTSVGNHEANIRPGYPSFIPKGQTDWTKGPVTRLNDVLSAEYILFRPVSDAIVRQSLMQFSAIDNFELENDVFKGWLSGLTEQNGVRLISESRVRLLEIMDHARFERAVDQFVADRSWRAVFNKANPRRYWSAAETLPYIRTPMEKEIQFGDLYTLHALTIRRTAEEMQVEIWWEEMKHEEDNKQRFMFFHLIDVDGNIYRNQQIELNYKNIYPDRRWRYDSITFPLPIDPKVKTLAFGISHPNRQTGSLAVDKVSRKWGGHRRVVVPLTAVK